MITESTSFSWLTFANLSVGDTLQGFLVSAFSSSFDSPEATFGILNVSSNYDPELLAC